MYFLCNGIVLVTDSHGSKNHEHTFRLNDEKDDEEQFNDQPPTIYKVVPPANGSNGPGIHELIEGDCCHCYQILRRHK